MKDDCYFIFYVSPTLKFSLILFMLEILNPNAEVGVFLSVGPKCRSH